MHQESFPSGFTLTNTTPLVQQRCRIQNNNLLAASITLNQPIQHTKQKRRSCLRQSRSYAFWYTEHQNPSFNNPFVAKNHNLYSRARLIWIGFWNLSSCHVYLKHKNTNDENVFRQGEKHNTRMIHHHQYHHQILLLPANFLNKLLQLLKMCNLPLQKMWSRRT